MNGYALTCNIFKRSQYLMVVANSPEEAIAIAVRYATERSKYDIEPKWLQKPWKMMMDPTNWTVDLSYNFPAVLSHSED